MRGRALAVAGVALGVVLWAALSRPPGVEELVAEDPAAAVAAARRLERGGDATPLLAGLDHPSERVRARSLRLMGRMQQGPADRLVACLSDPAESVRVQAARALTRIRTWTDPGPLLRSLADRQEAAPVRADLAMALGLRRERRAEPILVEIAGDPTEPGPVRQWALYGLARMQSVQGVGPAVSVLRDGQILLPARLEALCVLGRSEHPAGEQALVAAVADASLPEWLRGQAAVSLWRYASSRERLLRLAREAEDLPVRVGACIALRRQGIEVEPPPLGEALSADAWAHRWMAAAAVAELDLYELYGELEVAEGRETEERVRCTMTAALCRLRRRGAGDLRVLEP